MKSLRNQTAGPRPITIDINCDMGEGVGNDEAIMPFISSTNIACGFHAGDEGTMRQTIRLAMDHHVAVGAHPSFFDKANFGRTEMDLSQAEIYDLIILQLRTISRIAVECKCQLHHVKPHGALYNMSARDADIARAIAQAVKDFDESLILFGLSGSQSIKAAQAVELKFAREVFADRTYQDDGSLTPRRQSNALIETTEHAIRQVLEMIEKKIVTSVNGKLVPLVADTICIHGDGPNAIQIAKSIHERLKQDNIQVKAI